MKYKFYFFQEIFWKNNSIAYVFSSNKYIINFEKSYLDFNIFVEINLIKS